MPSEAGIADCRVSECDRKTVPRCGTRNRKCSTAVCGQFVTWDHKCVLLSRPKALYVLPYDLVAFPLNKSQLSTLDFAMNRFLMKLFSTKGKGSPYSITERRVPELIPVLGSQPAGDVNHKPDGRLPLLSARPAVTPATLKRAATNFAAW